MAEINQNGKRPLKIKYLRRLSHLYRNVHPYMVYKVNVYDDLSNTMTTFTFIRMRILSSRTAFILNFGSFYMYT